ncbi:MarR family winged helix-turn-helix transcriptional regulator [Arthrobacter sp. Z1-15]
MSTAHWTSSRLLSTAARLNDHYQSQRLTGLDVTHAGATTLEALAHSGPISQTRLADLVHIQAQTMGRVLEKLEVKGLVSRVRDTLDTRSIRTRITVRGQAVVESIDLLRGSPVESAGLSDQLLRGQLIALINRLEPTPA